MDGFFLEDIGILPKRMVFSNLPPDVPVTQLRSAYGPALARKNEALQQLLYGDGKTQPPRYALADLGEARRGHRAVRWTVIGKEALAQDEVLSSVWEEVWLSSPRRPLLAMGKPRVLGPSGDCLPAGTEGSWRLAEAQWPIPGEPQDTACRLTFPAGVSVRSKKAADRKSHSQTPDWPRMVRAACNKILLWLEPCHGEQFTERVPRWLAEAEARPAQWRWELDTGETRWSATQKAKLHHYRDRGHLDLPAGPGPVWPLLLAAHWLGLGHHTTEGIGYFTIRALQECASRAVAPAAGRLAF